MKQTKPITQPSELRSILSVLFKALLVTLGILSILVVSTLVVGAWFVRTNYLQFLSESGFTHQEIRAAIEKGWSELPPQTATGDVRVLLLGTDEVANRANSPILTDTMLLISANVHSGTIKLVSLPRDLWSDNYQTKINALYWYGQDRYPEEPQRFTTEVLEESTGLEIHHTVVLSLDQLESLISALGGVTIDIPVGFTDTQFPRNDVDIARETDPAVLYETVSFVPGEQTLDGSRALQYIRSRHSADDQGTDLARASRQQAVVSALFSTVQQPETVTSVHTVSQLASWYRLHVESAIPLWQVIGYGRLLGMKLDTVSLQSLELPVAATEDASQGIIYHPAVSAYDGQWVYAVTDQAAFKTWFEQNL